MKKVHLTPFQGSGRAVRRIRNPRLDSPNMANMLDVIICIEIVATSQTAGDTSYQASKLKAEIHYLSSTLEARFELGDHSEIHPYYKAANRSKMFRVLITSGSTRPKTTLINQGSKSLDMLYNRGKPTSPWVPPNPIPHTTIASQLIVVFFN